MRGSHVDEAGAAEARHQLAVDRRDQTLGEPRTGVAAHACGMRDQFLGEEGNAGERSARQTGRHGFFRVARQRAADRVDLRIDPLDRGDRGLEQLTRRNLLCRDQLGKAEAVMVGVVVQADHVRLPLGGCPLRRPRTFIAVGGFGATATEKASQSAGQQHHEQRQYQPHAERAPVLKFLETLIGDHQDDGADQRAPDRSHAADHDHGQQKQQQREREDGRPHDAKVGGIDRTGECGEKSRQRENPQLVFELADATRHRVARIVAQGPERKPERTANDDHGKGEGGGQQNQAEKIIRHDEFRPEQITKAEIAELADAAHAAEQRHAAAFVGREAFGVIDDQEIDHLRDGEREQRDIGALQSQAGEPDQHRDSQRQHCRSRHREPERPMEVIAEHRRAVGTAGKQRHLRQREDSADAEHQIPLGDDRCPDEEHRHLGDEIALGKHKRHGARAGEHRHAHQEIAATGGQSRTTRLLPKMPEGRQIKTAMTNSSSNAKPKRTPSTYWVEASIRPITTAAATAP